MTQKSKSSFLIRISILILLLSINLIESMESFQGSIHLHVPSDTWHKPCTDNTSCSIHDWDFTKCDTSEKFCICLEDKMYYDTVRKTCVVYADRTCTSYTVTGAMPCTEGATCVPALPRYTCKCDNGLPPKEGLCVK